MDIEKLKKMNEMSKTLQDHGFAENSEEGTKMAGELNDIEVQTVVSDSADLLLERITRKMTYGFEELKEQMVELRNAVESLASRPVQVVQAPAPAQGAAPAKAAPTHRQGGDLSQVKREDVKNGSDPAEIDVDVSVEKMFYYGNK